MNVKPSPAAQPLKRIVVAPPTPIAPAPTPAVTPVTVPAAAKPAAKKPVVAPKAPGFFARTKAAVIGWALGAIHGFAIKHPGFNRFLGNITGPIVKAKFNPLPGTKASDPGPEPLKAETIEAARKLMAERFKPAAGKAMIAISGGGDETVHCFVVSGVKPNGDVMITQALAQYSGRPEQYEGVGGWIRKQMDGFKHNKAEEMQGVVEESWSEYAVRSKRNSVVLMEVDADPQAIESALKDLKNMVGRPYDKTMLAASPATKASESGMYCTEISAWFVNRLLPGTVKMSEAGGGYPVFQVADHMRATDLKGGPLKVIYNGQNRLDVAGADPFPQDR